MCNLFFKCNKCYCLKNYFNKFSDVTVAGIGEYTLCQSIRGRPKLIYKGFSYVTQSWKRVKNTGSRSYWRCSNQEYKCNARAVLEENGMLILKNFHRHNPNPMYRMMASGYPKKQDHFGKFIFISWVLLLKMFHEKIRKSSRVIKCTATQ